MYQLTPFQSHRSEHVYVKVVKNERSNEETFDSEISKDISDMSKNKHFCKNVTTCTCPVAILSSTLSDRIQEQESKFETIKPTQFYNESAIIDDIRNKSNSNGVSSSLKLQKLSDIMSTNIMQHQEKETSDSASYFDFLDDFVRFDISRTGIPCFSGYSVSVQYEDDFLVGKTGAPGCCYLNMICSNKSRIRLWHDGKAFELVYQPRISCSRPKNCIYEVKLPHEENPVGSIHFRQDLVHIYNAYEQCLSVRRKQGSSFYSIKTETGDRLASVELFRGLRGDILYYGLSILGEISNVDKAILIGLTIAMDIRQRESEMRCSLIWIPLSCIVVIGLFSLLPWLYFYDENI